MPGLHQNQNRTNCLRGSLSSLFLGGKTDLQSKIRPFSAYANSLEETGVTDQLPNSAVTQSFHINAMQVQQSIPACSRPWKTSRPRCQDLTTCILGKLGQKPQPHLYPRKLDAQFQQEKEVITCTHLVDHTADLAWSRRLD